MRAAKLAAIAVALVAFAGLILQYVIFVDAVGIATASWRFIGFFTVLSNFGIGLMAVAIALGQDNKLTGARVRLMGLTAIVTVGFVYSLLLRSLWNPEGLRKIVDMALHDMTPILFAILWTLMPHGELKWGDLKWALAPPAIYLAYALTRGAFDGWYPYYFLNPSLQTPAELAGSIAGTLIVFAIIAGCGIALDRRLGPRTEIHR